MWRKQQKRPTTIVILNDKDLLKRTEIDTSPLSNPFKGRTAGKIRLCANCRSATIGWPVICDAQRHKKKSASALKACKARATPNSSRHIHVCYICERLGRACWEGSEKTESKFRLYKNLQLLTLLVYIRPAQEVFCLELSRRSKIGMSDARFLLASIAQKRCCHIHYHHTRHAMKIASQFEPSRSGNKHGFCVFFHKGCSGTSSDLRPLPMYGRHTLQETESFYEFHGSVSVLSMGLLTGEQVCGRYACGACRYIVSKGALGTRPAVDSTYLLDVVDRCLADCVLIALCVSNTQSVFISENEATSQEAQRLRKKVVAPFPNVPRFRFLPVREVFKSRLNLVEQNGSGSRNVCNKTIESRLGSVLSAKNVHLYSLS